MKRPSDHAKRSLAAWAACIAAAVGGASHLVWIWGGPSGSAWASAEVPARSACEMPFSLQGTVVSGAYKTAFFLQDAQGSGGTLHRLSEGERLDGYEVYRIIPDCVLLRKDGRICSLSLFETRLRSARLPALSVPALLATSAADRVSGVEGGGEAGLITPSSQEEGKGSSPSPASADAATGVGSPAPSSKEGAERAGKEAGGAPFSKTGPSTGENPLLQLLGGGKSGGSPSSPPPPQENPLFKLFGGGGGK